MIALEWRDVEVVEVVEVVDVGRCAQMLSSLVGDEVDHVEPDVVVVPHVQVSVPRAVGEHGQHAAWWPQVKGHVHRFALQQVKGEADSGVLGVGDVEDATGDEGVAGFGPGVGGVDIGGDGEGLLVQLSHHDALVHAGGEDEPQAVLVRRQLEVGLGVVQQVGQVVVQSVFDHERVKLLGVEVVSAGQKHVRRQRRRKQASA